MIREAWFTVGASVPRTKYNRRKFLVSTPLGFLEHCAGCGEPEVENPQEGLGQGHSTLVNASFSHIL